MKKGIILEQHRNYTIFLTNEGTFEKGRTLTHDGKIGEEVLFEPLQINEKSFKVVTNKRKHITAQVLSVACVLLLLILPFYLFPRSDETYAYVTVDINPSVELEIDEEYLVKHMRPVNHDASSIIEQLNDIENERLEIVIQMIMDKSVETGLINSERNMLVGISFLGDHMEVTEDIVNHLESHLRSSEPDWDFATFHVPNEIRKKAKEKQTSMNEELATTYVKENSISDNLNEEFILDDREIEIIDSFYNKDDEKEEKMDVENIDKDENNKKEEEEEEEKKKEKEEHKVEEKQMDGEKSGAVSDELNEEEGNNEDDDSDSPHPSELKSKNGEIHSNGKNIEKKDKMHQKKEQSNNGNGPPLEKDHPRNNKENIHNPQNQHPQD